MYRVSSRSPLPHLVLLVLAALLAAAACGTAPSGGGSSPAAPGNPGAPVSAAPLDFQTSTVGGGRFSGSSLRGEAAVLWFWAPWCPTCRAEAPHVSNVAERYSGAVTFVGIAGRGEKSQMRDFVGDTGVDSFTHAIDTDGSIWSSFGVTAQPAFAFISPDGEMQVVAGSLPEQELAARVEELSG